MSAPSARVGRRRSLQWELEVAAVGARFLPIFVDVEGGFGLPGRGRSSLVTQKYRLVTRSDFDGLVCAVLLKELGILDDIKFVHPKDMQDGKVEVSERDITTNVPYVPGVHLAFDHHLSETSRVAERPANHIIDPKAPSAARVVYDHYGGKARFPRIDEVMMAEVDKADAAQFSRQEILEPGGWVLLNYLMDPRTGLGRFRDFTISNYQLMMNLIDACSTLSIDEILSLPDVKERVDLYHAHAERARAQLLACSTVHQNLVVLDLREQEIIHPTNRFLIYAVDRAEPTKAARRAKVALAAPAKKSRVRSPRLAVRISATSAR